jgi:hypothetical protein
MKLAYIMGIILVTRIHDDRDGGLSHANKNSGGKHDHT